MAYSPDSRLIAVDGTYVFDAATLQPLTARLRPISWDVPIDDDFTSLMQFVVAPDNTLNLDVQRFGDT